MTRANFKQYQSIFKALCKCFRVTAANNEEILARQMINMHHGIPSTLVQYIDRFMKFPTLFQSALVEYLDALDYYFVHVFKSANGNSTHEVLIYQDQHDLENALYKVVALIGSCEYISSVEIVEGGRDHQLNEILEIEGSGTRLGKARVIDLIDGHIRQLTVQDIEDGGDSNKAIGYETNDKLIAMENENNSFDIYVSEIKSGYIETENIEDSQLQTSNAGFSINDSTSTNLQSTDTVNGGSGVNLEVTGVSGQLRSIKLTNNSNNPDEATFQHGDKLSIDPGTDFPDNKNAEVTIRTITPRDTNDIIQNHSISLSNNSKLSSTRNNSSTYKIHTLDINDSNTKKALLKRGATQFELFIDQMLFDPEKFDLTANTAHGSSIDDPIVLNDGSTDGLITRVKQIDISTSDLYNYIQPSNGAQAKINEEFRQTLSIDDQVVDKVTVTEIDLAAGALNDKLTSKSTSTHDYKAIGTTLNNFQYGGSTAGKYTATVTGITYPQNGLVNSVTINTDLQSSDPIFSQSSPTTDTAFTYTGLTIQPSIDSITVPVNTITQNNEIKIKDGVTITTGLTNGRNKTDHHGTVNDFYKTETYNGVSLKIDITEITEVP